MNPYLLHIAIWVSRAYGMVYLSTNKLDLIHELALWGYAHWLHVTPIPAFQNSPKSQTCMQPNLESWISLIEFQIWSHLHTKYLPILNFNFKYLYQIDGCWWNAFCWCVLITVFSKMHYYSIWVNGKFMGSGIPIFVACWPQAYFCILALTHIWCICRCV